MRLSRFLTIVGLALFATSVPTSAAELERRTWTIDGVEREALVYVPKDAKSPLPTVFAFHGHGGTSKRAATMFHVHDLWPEALVIYPQGLNTPGQITDPEGKRTGWQRYAGDQGDRDLKFFDAIVKSFRDEKKIDDARVYVTGHSNGGAFSYQLWGHRGEVFAAVAPSAALDAKSAKLLKPKPAMHIGGDNDPLVKFEWQAQMIKVVKGINKCEAEGKKDPANDKLTTYESKVDAPLVTYIHSQKHALPKDAPALIVEFFKSHPGKSSETTKTTAETNSK